MLAVLFAAMTALAVGLFGTALLIPFLRSRGVVQPIQEEVAQHAHKTGTPTMGALALVAACITGYGVGLLLLGVGPSRTGIVLVAAVIAGGCVGAIDDWFKVSRGRNTLGLRERQKSVLLLVLAAGYLAHALSDTAACTAPSITRCGPFPTLPRPVWGLFVLGVIWLTANSVNFTDGLDGLLAGSSVPPLVLLALIAFWQYRHPAVYDTASALEISLVLTSLAAGCLGLLWWSAAPNTIHMGETGSLAIGSAIAIAALALHVELLIPIFGGLFVAEGLSSMLQRYWFKLTRRLTGEPQRLFRMAPLHHHFEFLDWSEVTIVTRFWILSAVGSGLAGGIFYADAFRQIQ